MKKYICLIFILLNSAGFGQNFQFVKSIGNFNGASSFYISPVDFIYVTDINSNEIYKLSLDGELLKTAGGTGWTNEAFDSPTDVYASILYILVTDKNNHAIKLFDKDLNFSAILNTQEVNTTSAQFRFPLACVYSKQGDMFILDSENKRVVKFDIFRNFSNAFGGFDYGKFSLSNPTKLAINEKNDLLVLDNNKLVVFDQFGTGINVENLPDSIIDIRIVSDVAALTGPKKIYISNLSEGGMLNLSPAHIDLGDELAVSSIYYQDRLYVLTQNSILIYKRIE